MTINNGDFHEAGSAPGLASGWSSSFVAAAEEFADFAQNPSDAFTLARESFERGWGTGDQDTLTSLGLESGVVYAEFDVGPSQRLVEDYESGWGTPPLWMAELSALDPALFGGSALSEDHESWFAFYATLPSGTAALFGGSNPAEDFEAAWFDTLDDAGTASGLTESYESVYEATVFTVDASTDTLTAASVPTAAFVDNEKVFFTNEDGSLPDPLNADTPYFVSDPSGASFQVAPVSASTEINLTTVGEGTHKLTRDPSVYWSRVLTTV